LARRRTIACTGAGDRGGSRWKIVAAGPVTLVVLLFGDVWMSINPYKAPTPETPTADSTTHASSNAKGPFEA
jgi:hypothetical protein